MLPQDRINLIQRNKSPILFWGIGFNHASLIYQKRDVKTIQKARLK